jgi:hypothetical protein
VGYAYQKLRVPANPLEPSNRRISLIVEYLVKDEDETPVPVPSAAPDAQADPKTDAKPGETHASHP